MAVCAFGGGKRGCGYPQVGGLYLVSEGMPVPCDRLPMELPVCPVCGEHIRFSRSMQQINPLKLFNEHEKCRDKFKCPACKPVDAPAGLMWAGEAFYTPDEFVQEAMKMGVSKRIAQVPEFFKVGQTWLFIAHKKALKRPEMNEQGISAKDKDVPGIIYVCRPARLEKVMKESDITPEKVKEYEERGIDILSVPDDDDRFTGGAQKKGKKNPLASLAGE